MASVYARGKIRWVKFYPPGCSQPSRQSLGEVDSGRVCREQAIALVFSVQLQEKPFWGLLGFDCQAGSI